MTRVHWILSTLVAAQIVLGAAHAQACGPTQPDAMGPFYVSGTPVVEDLNRWGKPGEPLQITGRILDASAPDQPVADARIELWQTDGEGRYHPESNGPASRYGDQEIDLRGTVTGDAQGRYTVASLVPGTYEPRPRHIHYRISAPGFQTLVTQIYVSDGEPVPGGPCRSVRIERSDQAPRIAVPDILLPRS